MFPLFSGQRWAGLLTLATASCFALIMSANSADASRCIALAKKAGASYASATIATPASETATNAATDLAPGEVRITFVGHATFRIESPQGVIIATDFAGFAGGVLPTVVTMNRAHTTHWTPFPDPNIRHVLKGWGPDGAPADHNLKVDDVLIRNVTTDVRDWGGGRVKDGNSFFIFEIEDLCIGHTGHLHHELGPEHLALIGQLDVLMLPVDGGYTMRQESMVEVVKLLKARLVLPMHAFTRGNLAQFMARMADDFATQTSAEPTMVVTSRSLPDKTTVLALGIGETIFESYGDD